MDSPLGGLSRASSPVAGHGRPFCCLSKSPLLHLFLALPRSSGDGDGRSTPILGPPPGLCVPSLGYNSAGPTQALLVIRSCADSDCPLLASEAMVSGPAGPSGRPFGGIASSSRSPHPTSLSTGFIFMPGDSPAICQGCGILFPRSFSGWLGSAIFFSHQLPAEVVSLSPVVQVGGPLHLSSLST